MSEYLLWDGRVNRWGEEAGPTPAPGFATIVADPPWPFKDRGSGGGRGAAKHYDLMTLAQIKAFELPAIADDARLFLWCVESQQQEALDVVTAWGFKTKTSLIWIKEAPGGRPHFGMGHQVRAGHERCIIATRGRPVRSSAAVRSWFRAKVGEHSAKPEAFFDLVEKLSPGPYVELFARRQRPGWTCLGDQSDLLPTVMRRA